MNLFILEQVLDSSGRFLLTWQQIKHIRAYQRKGRIPSWFTKLEKKVLKEENQREVQDLYQTNHRNWKAIKITPKRITQDRRKKE